MRARCINVSALANELAYTWRNGYCARFNFAAPVLNIINLSEYESDLYHLYRKCKDQNVREDWIVQALVWYLNNI